MMQNKIHGWRSKLFFLVRLLVSAGLVVYLLTVINWSRAFNSISRSDKLLLIGVPLITLGSFAVSALRWKTILADNQVQFPWFQAFRGYVLALFYGTFLPGVLGGDAIRIGICVQKTRCSVSTSTAAVLLERFGGVVSLFCLLFLAYFSSPQLINDLLAIRNNQFVFWIAVSALTGMMILIITRSLWFHWLPESHSNSFSGQLIRLIRSFASTLVTLQNRSLFIILIYCILFQLFDIAATFTLSDAIGLHLSPITFFIVLPLTYLVLMLPISLGGLGLREGSMVFLLSRFGISASDAIMLSFLIYLNRMIIGLMGGSFHFLELLIAKRQANSQANSFLPQNK
jgi:glycosyltransferase 2 family protein